jgi:hypothetical protein
MRSFPAHRVAFALLSAAIMLPTLLAWSRGSAPASYRMFTRPERLRMVMVVFTPQGQRNVPLARVAPHLTEDARRVLHARGADGSMIGEVSAEALTAALPGLAALLCELVPDASRADVLLERHRHASAPYVVDASATCVRR